MSGTNFNMSGQPAMNTSSQTVHARGSSKPQISAAMSSTRRSPSPKPSTGTHISHSLLSQGSSSSSSSSSPIVTRLSPPVGQFIINTLLQIAGFVAAIAFGIYAVQSVTVSRDANQAADVANQLALLGLCLQSGNQTSPIESVCSRVVYYAATVLPQIATTLFPDLPTTVPTSPSTPDNGPESDSSTSGFTGILAGIIVGSIVGCVAVGLILRVCIKRRRARKYPIGATAPVAVPGEKQCVIDDSSSVLQNFRRLFMETRVVTGS